MSSAELVSIFVGPLTAVLVSWLLSVRSNRALHLETRVQALEVAQASLQATTIARLDAIDSKLDALNGHMLQ